MKTLGKIAI